MCKFDNEFRFLFDDKIFLLVFKGISNLYYRIDEVSSFISFLHETKKLKKGVMFGYSNKNFDLNWWKNSRYEWKEVSK